MTNEEVKEEIYEKGYKNMTLDEEIKHCEEVAEENEKNAKSINNIYKKSCLECASEYRQLAEWLRELKKWRALSDSINMLCDVDCEYPQYKERGTMCDACPIGTVKDFFEQTFDVEVNADGEGSDSE